MAARLGHSGFVQKLLLSDATPNVWTPSLDTPLSIAITNGSADVVCDILLGCRYSNPNKLARSPSNPTPLRHAFRHHNPVIVQALRTSGYDSSAERRDQREPGACHASAAAHNQSHCDGLTDCRHDGSLQHECRLVIRKCLNYNIWTRAQALRLPQAMKNMICFKEERQKLMLATY